MPAPEIKEGDKVKLRGRKPRGIVKRINSNGWTRVMWTGFPVGPAIVDIKELEHDD